MKVMQSRMQLNLKNYLKELKDSKIFAILHNIRSAHNVGAIFRTADATKIEKLYLTGFTPTPLTNKKEIEKTALGAENYLKWEKYQSISYLLKKLKKENFTLVAVEQDEKSIPYFKFRPKFPLVLIFGNEVLGLDKRILKKVDFVLEIPMLGKKRSLNVAVAFGIVVYRLRF